jgi:hypothetical protein
MGPEVQEWRRAKLVIREERRLILRTSIFRSSEDLPMKIAGPAMPPPTERGGEVSGVLKQTFINRGASTACRAILVIRSTISPREILFRDRSVMTSTIPWILAKIAIIRARIRKPRDINILFLPAI